MTFQCPLEAPTLKKPIQVASSPATGRIARPIARCFQLTCIRRQASRCCPKNPRKQEDAAGQIDGCADHQHDDAAECLVLAGAEHDTEAGHVAIP